MPAKAKKKEVKAPHKFGERLNMLENKISKENWLEGYDQSAVPMEQNLRREFDNAFATGQITADSVLFKLYKVGPVKLVEFNQGLKDLIEAVRKAKGPTDTTFYMAQKPQVVGKESPKGMTVIAFVYGCWH